MTHPAAHGQPERRPVIVWDLPIRLFHWLVVLLVPAAYVTQQLDWMDTHARVGEVLLALLIFRLLWGVLGSDTARFRRFLAPPGAALRHLAHLFRPAPDLAVGHNAAGGWSIVLLLFLLLGETLTGLYVNNDVADEGPLTERVPVPITNAITALHAWLWYALLAAIALHLLAIATYALAKGQNLVGPMLTGRKTLPADTPTPRRAPVWWAVLLLGLATAATALVATRL